MKSINMEFLKSQNYGDLIVETKYWFILLASDQKNIGTCIVALKRYQGDLGELNHEEWLEFSDIVNNLQIALKQSFNPVMFNWGYLINTSYHKKKHDPHVHWHVIPRYKEKIEFEGLIFEDPCFGYSTLKSEQCVRIVPQYVRIKIIKKIKENYEYKL